MPPILGSSQHLLNRDHAATYYAGMPRCLPYQPTTTPHTAADADADGETGRSPTLFPIDENVRAHGARHREHAPQGVGAAEQQQPHQCRDPRRRPAEYR